MNSKDQMWEYFTTLFSDLAENEQIHIRCLDTSGTAVAHAFFPTIDRAILFCLKHSGKNHVYPAVNPRDKAKVKEEKASGRTKGGGKNTVSRVVAIWADYDLDKFGRTKEEALEYLQNLSCPPSMIVFTGGGLQLYCGVIHLMHGKVPVYSTYEASFSRFYRLFEHFGQPAWLRL